MRKIAVLLFSFAVVFGAFLIYRNNAPSNDLTVEQSNSAIPDMNDQYGENVGQIDDTTYLHELEKAVFPHYDSQGRLDRRFGFQRVLARVADEWEIEQPYIDILKDNFKCFITAEKGRVRRQAAQTGSPTAKDASFSGNVVIKIQTGSEGDPNDNIIYLDDIVYVSDKNLFFTTGPVKAVSEKVLLEGTGLELIYNEDAQRFEFFKIIHLDKLIIKDIPQNPDQPEDITDNEPVKVVSNANPTPDSAAQANPRPAPPTPQADSNDTDPKPVTHYQLTLKKNVIIDAPRQLVFADNLFIHNIASRNQSSEKITQQSNTQPAPPKTSNSPNASVSPKQTPTAESNKPTQNITVTCDDGLIARPVESPLAYDGSVKISFMPPRKNPLTPDANDPAHRQKLVTSNIDYYHDTEKVIASGKSRIRFYAAENQNPLNEKLTPVDVTFSDKATFTPDANQVVLNGNCICLMKSQQGTLIEENRLSSDKIIIDLDKSQDSSASQAMGMKNLLAQGKTVRLSTVKKQKGKMIKGTELKSQKIVYNTSQKMFQATGPGDIKIDNTKVQATRDVNDSNDSAFSEKYFAIITDFDTLTYLQDANQIIAKSPQGKELFVQYFPVDQNGQYGQTVEISAKNVTASIAQSPGGQNEISDLNASGGITYIDSEKQFEGSMLVFDSDSQVVTILGDESYPCRINGTPTGTITYNLKTGNFKGQILAPGVFNTPQKK